MAAAVAALLVPSAVTPVADAATITVCGNGCDWPTIQGAVNAADPGDEILLLTSQPHTEADIVVFKSVEIRGAPGLDVVVRAAASAGSNSGRVFTVLAGVAAVLSELTISNGSTTSSGGGILNLGDLTLDHVVLWFNQGSGGGAIDNQGVLHLVNSEVQHCTATTGFGGGIVNRATATLVAIDSFFASGDAEVGGNLANFGDATLTRCRLFDGSAAAGGGVFNSGDLTMTSVTLALNRASGGTSNDGAGIYQSSGSTTIDGGVLYSNHATGDGGALFISAGSYDVSDANVFGNSAGGSGGGVAVISGAARFNDSTLFDNTAGYGGGAYQASATTLRFTNCTLSGNDAEVSGGAAFVADQRSVSFASSTVADNIADSDQDNQGDGGGVAYGTGCTGLCLEPRAYFKNSILAGNVDRSPLGSPAHECAGEIVSNGYNLLQQVGTTLAFRCRVTGDLTGVLLGLAPLLEPLADNGGPEPAPGQGPPRTHALQAASPAIGMGNPNGCRSYADEPLPADERGAPRVGACDLGAFEYGGTVPTPTVFSDGFESGDLAAWSHHT